MIKIIQNNRTKYHLKIRWIEYIQPKNFIWLKKVETTFNIISNKEITNILFKSSIFNLWLLIENLTYKGSLIFLFSINDNLIHLQPIKKFIKYMEKSRKMSKRSKLSTTLTNFSSKKRKKLIFKYQLKYLHIRYKK